MHTKRKSNNYTSPYSHPASEYPSQSSEFIPLHLGGLNPPTAPHEHRPRIYQNSPFQHRQNSRGYGGERYPRRGINTGGYNGRGGGFNNNQSNHFRRFSRGNNRGGSPHYHQQHTQSNVRKKDPLSSYFHSSMLEDPWKELMERHNALNSSIIDVRVEGKDSDDTGDLEADSEMSHTNRDDNEPE